jgi:hypothetical protein
VRRWGAIGLLTLKEQAAPAADALLAALADPAPDVRLTAAESLCGLGKTSQALPVLIDLLTHESRIIRNETLLALCRIGQPARAALPHLDKSRGSSTHSGLWSYDNIPPAIDLARACLGERFSAAPSQPKGRGAARRAARDSNVLKSTRQKYLP